MQYNWKKNTAIFLAGQAVSILGSSLVQFAITAHIILKTGSGISATISILCAILPTFLLSPFAGVWADRFNRKILIMAADGFIAAATLIVAILYITGYEALWLLYAVLAVRALGAAVQTPAVGAILPDIVPEEHLTRINGINGSMQSLFALASPMLGALLLSFVPLGYVFFVDVITAGVAIVIMLTAFVLPERKIEAKADGNFINELLLGIKYIMKRIYLKQFFLFCFIYFFMMAPAAFLTQLQVVRNYGDDYFYLAAIEVAFSAGMLIGGIAITAWGGFKNRIHTMFVSTLIMGICTLLLGIKIPFAPYVGLMVLFGAAMPLLNTPATVMLQERVDYQYLGRVMSIMTMINTSMMPLGMVLFGPLADLIPIEWLLLGTGAFVIAVSFFMVKSTALIKAGMTGSENSDTCTELS